MRLFKTLRTQRPSFSDADGSVSLAAPKSWTELSQEQLHYVLTLLATFKDATVVKTYMLIRFSGFHVVRKDRYGWICWMRSSWWRKKRFFTVQTWQIQCLLEQLAYIDSYESMDVRLWEVNGFHAVDRLLHGVRFIDYLNAEKYYQAYNVNNDERMIEKLASILYRDKKGKMPARMKLSPGELLGVYLWYAHIKSVFSREFPNFFKRLPPDETADFDILKAMNTQIRALTDGDVTKEQEIYNIDCWRALTELDQKAREAEEFNKRMKK